MYVFTFYTISSIMAMAISFSSNCKLFPLIWLQIYELSSCNDLSFSCKADF